MGFLVYEISWTVGDEGGGEGVRVYIEHCFWVLYVCDDGVSSF